MLEEELNRIHASFLRAFRTYQNSLELVDLEEDNLANAEETLDIALERFRQGIISAIEFREAQRAFLSAESRLIEAKYDAKIAETELLRLTGGLQHVAL
jgi:outer membrane protein